MFGCGCLLTVALVGINDNGNVSSLEEVSHVCGAVTVVILQHTSYGVTVSVL